jgi:glyoxylase-like metal-dependent hydrolase (beta-lactamase superfamily II)
MSRIPISRAPTTYHEELIEVELSRSDCTRVLAWLGYIRYPEPTMKPILVFLFAFGSALTLSAAPPPEYTIEAIRYATVKDFPLSSLVMGAARDQKTDIAMVVWLIRGGGRTILFDSGCHRQKWLDQFHVSDFMSPDEAVKGAGVDPSSVTDVVISHAHWDHMGGIDLFPNATIWIQKAEYEYYTGAAWQPGGKKGGIDTDDVTELLRRNLRGQVRLVNGDNVEIFPGITVYTGARHTFASQYLRVAGESGGGLRLIGGLDGAGQKPYVLASDNCYLYENLRSHRASATFEPGDQPGNIAAQERMIALAGSADRVVPGHDPLQFEHFPTKGRVAKIQ